jgi:hypothetical protein
MKSKKKELNCEIKKVEFFSCLTYALEVEPFNDKIEFHDV